jgi:hypothetical protein
MPAIGAENSLGVKVLFFKISGELIEFIGQQSALKRIPAVRYNKRNRKPENK